MGGTDLTFDNPVIRGFNPDPTICTVPGTGTVPTSYFLSTSTFELFPGAAIYTSTDLINWRLIGHALTRRSQLDLRTVEPGAGSWASTLRYRPKEKRWYLANGLFHRYRPASDERIFPRGFYVYTDNIWDDSCWSDPIYFDNPGFDQDLFWDDDTGKVFLSTTVRLATRSPPTPKPLKDFAIHVSEIDLRTGRTLTRPRVIRKSPHGIAEGSHLLRRGDFYYLFTAEGGTEAGHQEWVFRSPAAGGESSSGGVFGPWEGQGKPLWYNGPEEEVQRTGHADLFEDGEGRWWAVLLGVRPMRGAEGSFLEPQLGRETFLVKVDWVDDWPVFNGGRNITIQTQGHEQTTAVVRTQSKASRTGDAKWEADLTKADLELGWYQKNTPLKKCYTLTENPAHLRIYGDCYDLSSPECPALLLRKQTSYSEVFQATMGFLPNLDAFQDDIKEDPSARDNSGEVVVSYEAGVTLWWNQYSYASVGIGVCKVPGRDDSGRNGGSRLVRTVVCKAPTGVPGEVKTWYPLLPEKGSTSASSSNDVNPNGPDVPAAVRLSIEASPTQYKCRIQGLLTSSEKPADGGGLDESFVVDASALTAMPPVGGAFCGAMFGLYSFGKWEPVLEPADFEGIRVLEV